MTDRAQALAEQMQDECTIELAPENPCPSCSEESTHTEYVSEIETTYAGTVTVDVNFFTCNSCGHDWHD